MDVTTDVVIKSRHTGVPQQFRDSVAAKVVKLSRHDPTLMRVDVELSREHNPRLAANCEHVELTLQRPGAVLRAAASAPGAVAALDLALDKAVEQLRRIADREHCRGARVHAFVAAQHANGDAAATPDGPEPD